MRLRMTAPLFLLACAAAMLAAAPAHAISDYLLSFEAAYPAAEGSRIDVCLLCHVNANPNVGAARNAYGSAYSNANYDFPTIEPLDSDGDGFTNLEEIVALTFPGNAGDHPARVPNVVGMAQANASTAILAASLVVGTVTQAFSATVPAGSVIDQTPTAGTVVALSTAVSMTVSKGPQPVITGSILINRGAFATNSATVSLSLTWSSNAVRMRFSDNGMNWTPWETLKATRAYTLPAGDGYKTVRVQFLDIANNRSAVFSDWIILDTAPPTGSISINNGAQATASANVTLNLTSTDAGSGVQAMRFSTNGANWTLWEPVAATKAFTLPGPAGAYNTVRVQFRDSAGNYSAIYSDYIFVTSM